MAQELSKQTVFPSVRALLNVGLSCRQNADGSGWSVYWMDGEMTYFSGYEGPLEVDVDAVIEIIGGDCACYLTPASLKRLGYVAKNVSR